MKIIQQGNTTCFRFKGAGRASMMLGAQAFAFLLMVLVIVFAATTLPTNSYGLVFLGLLCCGLLYFAWRLISRISMREQLLVTPTELTLVRIVSGMKRRTSYPLAEIRNLCYIGDGYRPEHPLASQNLDPLGFGGRQALVNVVAEDGNLAFFHNDRMIRFGTRVPSWDAEKIDGIIREKTKGEVQMAGLPQELSDEVWNR